MKTKLLLLVSVVVLGSCSAPKYAYKFDYHDYNAGRKEKQAAKEVAANPGPVEIQPEMLVAEGPVVSPEVGKTDLSTPATKPAPLTVTKAEKRDMVKDLKQAVKKMVALKKPAKAAKSGDTVQTDQSTKAMDADLKMSLLFLIGSIIVGIIAGIDILPTLFWIVGTALLIIAILYFVRWLMRQ